MEPVQEVLLKDRITITMQDASRLTGIGWRRLAEMSKNDIKFPSFKIGDKTLIHVDLLDKYLAEKAISRVGVPVVSSRVAQIYAKREERQTNAK